MLLVFCVISQVIVTLANPLGHPFVYLLDVGDEQIDNVYTQKIGISLQGGSIAIRYPDTGDGDTISHIAATAVDLGAELKANIIDGGPGFQYVVLSFKGNPDKYYEVNVVVQTIPKTGSTFSSLGNTKNVIMNVDNDPYAVQGDINDSAEESETGSRYTEKMNAELTQSSSNVYRYAVNERSEYDDTKNNEDSNADDVETNGDDIDDDVNEDDNEVNNDYNDDTSKEKDIQAPSPEPVSYNENVEVEDYENADVPNNDENNVQVENVDENAEEEPVKVDRFLYNMYEALKPHLGVDKPVEPLDYSEQNEESYQQEPLELDQMFNDEEIHNDGKYWDVYNNNNFDTDDTSAVAY